MNPPISPPSTTAWHSLAVADTLHQFQADPDQGLDSEQVADRWRRYGPNELEERAGRPDWVIFADQFKNLMLIMLMAVAVVSAILDLRDSKFPKDAIAIVVIVILNGILGYVQESRAEKALAALKKLSSPLVRVLRQGQVQEMDARQLVPGDVVLLEAGGQVAADGRLLESASLQIRESALTGEATAVMKNATLQLPEDAVLGDRLNLVFQGTEIIQGRGTMVVTTTGMQTELGRIATMLQDVVSEPTPLQQRMEQLANTLVGGSLLLVVLVIGAGVWSAGWSAFEELLEVSLSMAVAVVPEGLPAVITVALALGTQRMVRCHALIRKLPAVETLGSVTTICSDKTGTLTQNKMVVQSLQTLDQTFRVTGEGYVPEGNILLVPQTDTGETPPTALPHLPLPIALICLTAVACNDALLQHKDQDWQILGDPTEGALLTLAGKGGYLPDPWQSKLKRLGEIPFSSERKRMSVACDGTQLPADLVSQLPGGSPGAMLFTKGSPELILERCTQTYQGGQLGELTPGQRSQILAQNEHLAATGLRVLGFAYRPLGQAPTAELVEEQEQGLIWLGLTGMLDAPRPEVRDAVARCRQAGIRPVMITGDHQLTAQAIAQSLGIAEAGCEVLDGRALSKMSQEELEQEVEQVSIYARVAPEHKLRIVQALQKRGQFVAMTGDGVNDAPALKQANIGIAMGITGTDVSKEASDMVLLDDNFASIVAATEEGRVVYTNIRRFIKYILGSNVGELITIAAAPLLGIPGVPLTPLQILWMNLVTDGVPALALAMEPAEPNVMQRPPIHPQESIFARGLGWYILRIGFIFAFFTIGLMMWAYGHAQESGDPDRWKTMVFTSLCLAQMGHAIAMRSNTQLTWELNPLTNLYVWGSVILTTMLQLLLIYVEPLRQFFGTHYLNAQDLSVCLVFSVVLFVWVEGEKLFVRWFHQRKGS
ncbi:cation-translocating P-type ATPase [Prochlorothrix hollandica]|uniref:Metal ABC transporter ATPase n=1 Tax=Prochlorothrix hollandica PCC 9006 = CALU 1027 TaxID=317619 RepID=A0A0M2PUY7_PROHO|nr:cation-translocating P-type ATPase [Prochlorothrix hollandica]KKI99939.1 metal ABC transporter ATPase [Prochlorothrix hollandica PCC 9006 = CALU 1027]